MPTVAPLDLDSYCLFAGFIGEVPVYALADGTVHRLDQGHQALQMHDGMTCATLTQDGKALISGGEDGLVRALNGEGIAAEIGNAGKKWVTAVAAGPNGAAAWAAGKQAWVRLADGTVKEFAEERSMEGLAFAPKGMRLATARYNGGTLHWVTTAGKPVDLEWKGAHTGICFSPDGATAWFIDSRAKKWMRVTVDPADGAPTGEPEIFFDHSAGTGNIDGAICDADGHLWNARYGSAALDCYAPDGKRLFTIDMPASQTTCPAFVGDGLIAVTSAFQNLDAAALAADPQAGKTFLVETRVKPKFEPKVAFEEV